MTLQKHTLANFKKPRTERIKDKRASTPSAKRKKNRDGNDDGHQANIRQCVCAIPGCNQKNIEIHHLKATGNRGMGMKSPDKDGVPLCHDHHLNGVERVGTKNELKWFADQGIDALELAAALWNARGDLEKMRRIVMEYRLAAA